MMTPGAVGGAVKIKAGLKKKTLPEPVKPPAAAAGGGSKGRLGGFKGRTGKRKPRKAF